MSGPRRILFVQKFPGLGGSQASLVHHLENLPRDRFLPRLVVARPGWLTERCDALDIGWDTLPFGHWTSLAALPRNLLLVRRLVALLRRHRIDLVHANEHWVAPLAYLAARRVGVPVICHFRTGLEDLTPARVRKYLYARYDRVLVVADVLRRALAARLADGRHVVVVRDGVVGADAPPPSWRTRRTRVAVCVGAIYPVKGQLLVLEKLAPWLAEGRSRFLLFVGPRTRDPAYVARMEAFVAARKLERQVLFLGVRTDVERLLRAADVLVAFSTVEGIPRVVMEAMRCGRPVIVSDTPGMEEVVEDGVVGCRLRFEDPANPLYHALADLDTRYECWEAMGRRGWEIARQQYSVSAMSAAIQAVYDELLEQRRP